MSARSVDQIIDGFLGHDYHTQEHTRLSTRDSCPPVPGKQRQFSDFDIWSMQHNGANKRFSKFEKRKVKVTFCNQNDIKNAFFTLFNLGIACFSDYFL